VQDRARQPGRDRVLEVPARVQLQHLPDLLGQGHPAQQVVDALLHGEQGITVLLRSGHENSSGTLHIGKRPEVSHSPEPVPAPAGVGSLVNQYRNRR
jgi:hypothetical protein